MGEASAVNRTLYTATAVPVPADGRLPSGRGCRTRLPPLDGAPIRRSRSRRMARPSSMPPGASTSTRRAARSSSASVTAAPRSPRPWPTRPAVSRTRTAARSPPSRSRPTRPRSAPTCRSTTRPVPGLRRVRGDRDRAQARPGVPPRRRRARPGRRHRPLGQLPRQHARRARPVRPPAAPPARTSRGSGASGTCPRPTRTGAGRPGATALADRRSPRRRAGAGHRGGGAGTRRGVRRRARSSGRRWPPPSRPTATGRDRRGLPPPRRAAHRRRGDDRVRADRALVRVRPLGRAAGPARGGQGRDVGLLAVRVRRRVRTRSTPRSPARRAASSTGSPTRTARSARRWPARCCGRSRPSGWSRRARPRATGCGRCSSGALGEHPARRRDPRPRADGRRRAGRGPDDAGAVPPRRPRHRGGRPRRARARRARLLGDAARRTARTATRSCSARRS